MYWQFSLLAYLALAVFPAIVFAEATGPSLAFSHEIFRDATAIGMDGNGSNIYVGDRRGSVKKFHLKSKRVAWSKSVHRRAVQRIVPSRNNRVFSTDGRDLKEIGAGSDAKIVQVCEGDSITVSGAGSVIHAIDDGRISTIVSIDDGKKRNPMKKMKLKGVPVDVDKTGSQAFIRLKGGKFAIQGVKSPKLFHLGRLNSGGLHGTEVTGGIFHEDGLLLAVSDTGPAPASCLLRFDLERSRTKYHIPLPSGVASAYMNDQGGWIATVGVPDVRVWNLRSGSHIVDLSTKGHAVHLLSARKDGKMICALVGRGGLMAWDIENLVRAHDDGRK